MELRLDMRLMSLGRALADPGPFLNQQGLVGAIRLQVDRSDDFIADEHGQGEIAEDAFLFGNIGFETMIVVEEKLQLLALNDQRIEGRKNMNQRLWRRRSRLERLRLGPMLDFPGAFDRDGNEQALAHSGFDQ